MTSRKRKKRTQGGAAPVLQRAADGRFEREKRKRPKPRAQEKKKKKEKGRAHYSLTKKKKREEESFDMQFVPPRRLTWRNKKEGTTTDGEKKKKGESASGSVPKAAP